MADRLRLARTLTWLEAGDPRGLDQVGLGAQPARAHVVGVTGAPGTGKSTLTSSLVGLLRARRATVAVLAVDPSSPLSGGALLGDRLRMSDHLHDPGVYIRSVASRGQGGGLALVVPSAIRALDNYGFDWILVESVGVGQVELDIADHADTTVLVVCPGNGDEVQASKAGVIEVADVIAVNKADQGGAQGVADDYRIALDLSARSGWRVPIHCCSARDGRAVESVLDAIYGHARHSAATGQLEHRRATRRRVLLREAVKTLSAERAYARLLRDEPGVVQDVARGVIDPLTAARLFVSATEPTSTDTTARR
ncbi:methylmalonyl Co-A mutase-associated GTPase MeaB [Sporichthya sp.]|uniref:methylmalonyl Co-A mutase-associated GTPase MeaB n=1 Tax=Sporichthya sp. TaxID=65475 RepID=UPI0025ECC00B|nr:methylmalonyl Co-A mutase-associated GTPase MeaB [Sporichthya sp.]